MTQEIQSHSRKKSFETQFCIILITEMRLGLIKFYSNLYSLACHLQSPMYPLTSSCCLLMSLAVWGHWRNWESIPMRHTPDYLHLFRAVTWSTRGYVRCRWMFVGYTYDERGIGKKENIFFLLFYLLLCQSILSLWMLCEVGMILYFFLFQAATWNCTKLLKSITLEKIKSHKVISQKIWPFLL